MNDKAFISVLSPNDENVPDGVREAFDLFRELIPAASWLGVPNIMRVFSLRPAYMRAGITLWAAMWHGPLPRQLKESLGVTVSVANQCPY
ncbi:MAG TPA: carboxymuconolactone decarboxylase family protein [Pirellulaceae bacterium]|nr:carboxymuconolactone decarboxylase family protein [Pirellulaceae bacterium]